MTTRAHYADMALIAAMASQPQVSSTLLCQFDASGLKLDLYGEAPVSGGDLYIVTDAALAGTTVSLFEILSQSQLTNFGYYCDRHLPDAAELAADARADAKSMQRTEWLGVGA